jgi:hypothetical protein
MIATSFIVLGLLQQTFIERELAWQQSYHPDYHVEHYVVTMFRIDTDMMFQRVIVKNTDTRVKLLWPRNSAIVVRVFSVFKRADRTMFEMASEPLFVETKKASEFTLIQPPIGIVE